MSRGLFVVSVIDASLHSREFRTDPDGSADAKACPAHPCRARPFCKCMLNAVEAATKVCLE